MLENLKIRTANINDAEQITLMAELLGYEEQEESSFCQQDYQNLLTSGAIKFIAAEYIATDASNKEQLKDYNNSAIGFAMYYPGYDLSSASFGFHLGDLFILPDFRQQKIATKMVEFIISEAKNNNMKWLSWTMRKNNHIATKFYHSFNAIIRDDITFMSLSV